MICGDPLARYLEERQALLERITILLKGDSRIAAAWLAGSLGRGQGDALSDLDVFIVIKDEDIRAVVDHRRDFVSQLDSPVLLVEAPQNAPPGGGYLMALYDAPTAPHQVDWNWLPYSLAAVPDQTALLFDQAGLPRSGQPQVYSGTGPVQKEIVAQPIHFISFFWAMLMITAKYAARSPWAAEMELLPYVTAQVHKTQEFLGRRPGVEIPEHRDPAAKLRTLRQLAGQMEALMTEVAARGSPVPAAIVPGAYRFLNLVEHSLASTTIE